ncbi:hypothetical protein [uncultured Veillonella sp.]|uniref:hypothetical protein n=1 Tax=uncultured Veillonella sp. TaxID=159268 RepID=UPI0025EB0E10|nr:hypothetical protein [uncultured Veillonella sp.]
MIEFFDRLVGPIDADGARIYRQRTDMTQLVVMIILSVICYQFTVIGDSVYADAMKNFIMNPTTFVKLDQLPMMNVIEINALLQKLNTTTPLWDVSSWLLMIVKALVMSILISGYALWRSRHCYTVTILTGVFHCIAYAQLVIGIYMLSLGVLLSFAKAPVILVLLLGVFLTIICFLLTMSLITVVGRIVGATVSGSAFEGLLVISGVYVIWVGMKFLGILLF